MWNYIKAFLLFSLFVSISTEAQEMIGIKKNQSENIKEILNGLRIATFRNIIPSKYKKDEKIIDTREAINNNTDFIKKLKFDEDPVIDYKIIQDGKYKFYLTLFIDAYQLRLEWKKLFYSDHITTNGKITLFVECEINVNDEQLEIVYQNKYVWRKVPKTDFHGIKLNFKKLLDAEIKKELNKNSQKLVQEISKFLTQFL